MHIFTCKGSIPLIVTNLLINSILFIMKTSTSTQVITLVIFVSILVLVIVFGDMKG